MATAINIIERALRSIGVLATGENPSAEMANDALVSLNDIIAGMANESLTIYQNTQDVLPMTGAASYTYGLSGALNSVRPIQVNTAFYRDANSIDYPVDVITLEEYNALGQKTLNTGIPTFIYIDTSYPLATVYVWPQASTGSLYLNTEKALTEFSSLNASVSLPSGYERMLRYALAAEMMTEYGVDNAAIMQKAIDSKADIKRTNYKPRVMRVSLPFGRRRGTGRIMSDGI